MNAAIAGQVPNPYLRPDLPSVFTLELTTRCQHNCLGCGNIFRHADQDMSLVSWQAILEKIHPFAQALRLTGGEPSLHPQFAEIIAQVDRLGIPFVVFTNANWCPEQDVLGILVRAVNLRGLLISLHGADPVSYSVFTQVDAFETVLDNIRRATNMGLSVAVNTLLLSTTYLRLEEISHLALEAGAATVSFGRYYGHPISNLSLSNEHMEHAIKQVAELHQHDKRLVVSNCIPACFLPEMDFGGRGCTSGFTHCTIGPFGEVRPCTHSDLVLGDIFTESIESIWNGEKLESWRRLVPDACLSCVALSRCRGGCRATAQQLGLPADPLMRVPFNHFAMPVVDLPILSCPHLLCSIELTPFGYALKSPGRYVTLSEQSKPILDAVDGHTTIEQIWQTHGDEAMQLIGSLLYAGIIELIGDHC